MKIKILIAEDDIDLGHLLCQYLRLNDFEVHRVFDGDEAISELKQNHYDIVIIDVMMPKVDGFTFAQHLTKQYPNLPFLFVTARKLKEDVLQGLKLGADDYIVKPFDADELILRIRNIIKRAQPQVSDIRNLSIGKFMFDPQNLTLFHDSTTRQLTEKERDILLYLYEHRNQVIKRSDLLDRLWAESDFFTGRSLDVFITRLRKILAEDPSVRIESIRGIGFRFCI